MFKTKLIRNPIINVDINAALHLYFIEDCTAFYLFGIYKIHLTVFKRIRDICVLFHGSKYTVKITV